MADCLLPIELGSSEFVKLLRSYLKLRDSSANEYYKFFGAYSGMEIREWSRFLSCYYSTEDQKYSALLSSKS